MTVQVVIGRVGRAHGIRGDVAVELRTDEPERRFAPGSSVVCSGTGRALTVVSSRPHQNRMIVRFAEIADRTQAESLHGQLLEVTVSDADRPDDDDAFYDRQLVGLQVRGADGRKIGSVVRVDHLPSQDLLVIAAESDRPEILVPFIQALVPEVDLDHGHLVVADVPGLLDPGAAEEARP